MTLEDLVGLTSYTLNHERASNCKVLKIRPRKNFQRFSFVIRGFESWSKPKGHIVTVLYPELKKKDLKKGSGATPLTTDPVLVFCTCPAFLYWGSKYWSTQDDYNIKVNVEKRPPYIRDPHKERYICKHIIRAARYMRKKGFPYLTKRFNRAGALDASLSDDIKPAVHDFMVRKGMDDETIKDFLLNMDEDNMEVGLEEVGIYVKPESGNIIERVSFVDACIREDILI